jgi:hypothetical protein
MIKILSQTHILDVEYFLHIDIGSGEYVEAVGDGTMGDSCDVSVSSLLTAAFYSSILGFASYHHLPTRGYM